MKMLRVFPSRVALGLCAFLASLLLAVVCGTPMRDRQCSKMEKKVLRVTLDPYVQAMAFRFPVQRSKVAVVVSVLLLHGLALWALQAGLLQRMVVALQEVVIPVSVIPALPMPPRPEGIKATAPDKSAPRPQSALAAPSPTVPALAAPAPLAIAEAPNVAAAPNAPTGVAVAQSAAAPAPAPALATPPAAPKVELPSSTADYLHNPKPKYPRLSQSRNEQGTVILSVLVGVDGRVREVAVKSSSGFELLDRTAREAVLGWTFVPGKRNGGPVEMLVDVPIPFRLTD